MNNPLRISITSLGCKVNYAEMESLASVLAASGCDIVDDDAPADVVVVNTCTVTLQADATSRQRIQHLRRQHPDGHLIVTGCSVDGNPGFYLTAPTPSGHPLDIDAVFPNSAKEGIASYIRSTLLQSETTRLPDSVSSLPPLRRGRAFIKVQDGCRHRCTYCSVWSARGASTSRSMNDILTDVRAASVRGHQECVLTGVDLGSYGRDSDSSLPELVKRIWQEIPDIRIRLSSINANDITPDVIALNAHDRFCPHWHIPLQSGSDVILKAMHRGYRRNQYLRVVERLRALRPETTVTTDIMTAFPGESDGDHKQTCELIHEAQFLKAHVFRYSPRPGTPAALLPEQIPVHIARRRSAELRQLAAMTSRAEHDRFIGSCLHPTWLMHDGQEWIGIAETYHEVRIPFKENLAIGTISPVTITQSTGTVLLGAPLQ
ncbi:MAG: MiaB/RimO family radical SAM methylthiotransferase [Candidatus Dormibacteria bacterium]